MHFHSTSCTAKQPNKITSIHFLHGKFFIHPKCLHWPIHHKVIQRLYFFCTADGGQKTINLLITSLFWPVGNKPSHSFSSNNKKPFNVCAVKTFASLFNPSIHHNSFGASMQKSHNNCFVLVYAHRICTSDCPPKFPSTSFRKASLRGRVHLDAPDRWFIEGLERHARKKSTRNH